jgi:hypothetical protein
MLPIMAVIGATSVISSNKAREPPSLTAGVTIHPFIQTVLAPTGGVGTVGEDELSELLPTVRPPGSGMGESV